MLLLTTNTEVVRVVTDSAATVDVHASWVDRSGTTDTAGSTNTAISSATTTTAVASPASSTARNVRNLIVRNKHASLSVSVTVQLYNGSTAYELDNRVLGPGQSLQYAEGQGFFSQQSGGSGTDPWSGVLLGCMNRGDPGLLMRQIQCGGNVAATPTNITTSVARCSLFSSPVDITINRIRYYGVGTTTGVYQVAIYRLSNLARLTSQIALNTTANTWGSNGSTLALSLTKNTPYFVACSVNATGTTAGIGCAGGTVAATTGQVATAPGSLPGSMAIGASAYLHGYFFQFAVTTGALPTTAASLVAQAAWTGGMPAFWLDTADV